MTDQATRNISVQSTKVPGTRYSTFFPSPGEALENSLRFPSRATKAASERSSKSDPPATESTPQDKTLYEEQKAAFLSSMKEEAEEHDEKVCKRRAARAERNRLKTTMASNSLGGDVKTPPPSHDSQ